MKKISIALTLLLVLSLVPLASAQDGSMGWIALETTKSGKSRNLISATIKEDGPMYDKLLASGTLSAWGIAIPINHSLDDDWNFLLWTNFADWSGVGAIQAGFEGLFASRTPEQMAAGQKNYAESTVAGAHHDWIVRHDIHRVNPTPPQPPRYFDVGYWTVHPGMEGQFLEFYNANVTTVLDKLLADGTLHGHGVLSHVIHGDTGFSHLTWVSISDLSALDTIDEAFQKEFSQDKMAEFMKLVEWDFHKDQILMIVHLGGTTADE